MNAYRGMSSDERRTARRTALLDAAFDALHQGGVAAVGVRAVCARAGLTARYFYENFDGLDALLLAVVDEVADDMARRSVAAFVAAPDDLHARVRAAIDAGYGVVATDPRKATALLVASAGHGALRERRRRLITDFADLLLTTPELSEAMRGGAGRAEFHVRALFLMGGTAEVIEAVLSGATRMSRRRVVDQLTDLWVAVVRDQPSASTPASRRSTSSAQV